MQEINYVSSESLIASIQEDLSSYDANNQLDPGRWYSWIKKVVSDLGLACYEYKHALVFIKDYHGPIECDFQILDSAFWVKDDGCSTSTAPVHFQGKSIIWDDTETACATQEPECGGCGTCDQCNYRTCELSTFNQVTVREYVQGLPYTRNMAIGHLLRVNQRVSKGWCLPHSICFGSTSMDEITINKDEIFTNFQEGIILLNYYVYPLDEKGLPKIPDVPKIQLALDHYIRWKAFENMWINNDDMGSQAKMMYYKNEFQTNSYADAEYWVKLTGFDEMLDISRNNRKRLNWAQLIRK